MRALYTTREGQKWELRNVAPITFAPGFYYGDRVDNGQLVQVHEHRLVFVRDAAGEGGAKAHLTPALSPCSARGEGGRDQAPPGCDD